MKTNEEAKQEAIKAAYGKHYEVLKGYIDKDGWLNTSHINEYELFEVDSYHFLGDHSNDIRLNELKGINDNNGWIRIEPDGSNLPTDNSIQYKVWFKTGKTNISYFPYPLHEVQADWEGGFISHYKPIKEEPKPIY